jgi:glutamine cyclotransferase
VSKGKAGLVPRRWVVKIGELRRPFSGKRWSFLSFTIKVFFVKRSLGIHFAVAFAALGVIAVLFYLNFRAGKVVPVYGYKVINVYPHDKRAFTQGLVFEGGFLYEGTGLVGRSTLRKVELETGKIVKGRKVSEEYFGEGITIYGDKIIQLTLRAKVGLIYDRESFELVGQFNYPTEGWGITHNGKSLIRSDGTSTLYFLNPETFEQTGRIEVTDSDGPVSGLNELEYVQGQIYANVWRTDRVARIDPKTGRVTGWIDLAGLLGLYSRGQLVDVLNGIAYDAANGRLFVTGKLWPKLFEIEPVSPK